jgi:hypothetical protein
MIKRIKNILITILIILVVIAIFLQLKKKDDEFMETCQKLGYSYNYCMEHK